MPFTPRLASTEMQNGPSLCAPSSRAPPAAERRSVDDREQEARGSQTASDGDSRSCELVPDTRRILASDEPLVVLDNPQNSDRPVQWFRLHNFVVSGSWIVPRTSWRDNGGLVFSGVFRSITGDRFTITNSARIDNNNREVAVAGDYNPNNPNDISLSNVRSSGKVNGSHDPVNTTLDFSSRYRVPFGSRGWYATISVDAFNITNKVNWANSGQTRTSLSGFLIPRSARDLRKIQIGIRFSY